MIGGFAVAKFTILMQEIVSFCIKGVYLLQFLVRVYIHPSRAIKLLCTDVELSLMTFTYCTVQIMW